MKNKTIDISKALKCKVIGFWANSRPDLCKKYISGHDKILRDHGLKSVILTNEYWVMSDKVYVVLALDENEVPVGGIRLESKIGTIPMPFEKVLVPSNPDMEHFLDRYGDQKVYEACGLWNARSVAGNDLGIFLSRVCVAMAPQIGIDVILSLNGVYTYKLPRDMGSHIVRDIGEDGLFKYPIERFHSALWEQNDLEQIKDASEDCRKRVFSLRQNPFQTCFESNNKNGLLVNYDLYL